MDTKILIELFGYLGSALVVVSMLMTSVVRLRVINMIGSIIFAIYALIIRSYPTALMNFFLVGINIYHLIRLRNTENNFHLVETGVDDRYLDYLLSYYETDIKTYFSEFFAEKEKMEKAYIITLDSEPVGMAMGRIVAPETLDLDLDYSMPAYRDCSVGNFLYPELKKEGFKKLIYDGKEAAHIEYLKKVGFAEDKDGSYVKEL